eukprot:g59848.t1
MTEWLLISHRVKQRRGNAETCEICLKGPTRPGWREFLSCVGVTRGWKSAIADQNPTQSTTKNGQNYASNNKRFWSSCPENHNHIISQQNAQLPTKTQPKAPKNGQNYAFVTYRIVFSDIRNDFGMVKRHGDDKVLILINDTRPGNVKVARANDELDISVMI